MRAIEFENGDVVRIDVLTSVLDAAERLGTYEMAVYRLLRAGQLRGKKIGGRWLVDSDDVERFRRERAATTGTSGKPSEGAAT